MARKSTRRARQEGTVFHSKAKDCWVWRAVVGFEPSGSVRYKEGRARSQSDALRLKRDAEKGNRQPHDDKETVKEHLDHWLLDIAKPNTRRNTFARYEQVVRLHLTPRIGGVPLRRLTVAQVTRTWSTMSQEGMTAGNIKTCSEVLASALEAAVTEGKIVVAPTRAAVKPRVISAPVEVFQDGEVRAILAAAQGHRLEALFVVAIATGAREGELLALEDTDLNVDAGTLAVTKMLDQTGGQFLIQPPKSKSGVRTISLPTFARAAMKRHMADRGPGTLFTDRAGGYIRKSNFVRRDWTDLLAAAGVAYRKFHTMRHTHASRLLADGVDPAEVARRIGDRIETVMRVYAHWIETQGRDTAGRIEMLYGSPGPRLANLSEPPAQEPEGGGKVAIREVG